jgi:lysophospholipase L1-like esterase
VRHGAPTVAAALLLLAACSSPGGTQASGGPSARKPSPATSTPSTPQGPYVALGDSYTSGPEIPEQVGSPAGCERSNHNYPTLVAAHLKLKAGDVRDVSCSGATIADLTASQSTNSGTNPAGTNPGGTNPAQFSALTSATRLVTLGIGGNDLDFAGVLTRCVELDAPGTVLAMLRNAKADATPCRAYYTLGGNDQIQQKIQAAQPAIAAALERIHQLAPSARVFVVGYPDLLPADGADSCSRSLALTPGDVAYLGNAELAFNSMLRQQAAAAHDPYVDTYTPSLGHDACSAAATRWIEPLLTDAAAAPLHPNAVGEQGIAAAVERALMDQDG